MTEKGIYLCQIISWWGESGHKCLFLKEQSWKCPFFENWQFSGDLIVIKKLFFRRKKFFSPINKNFVFLKEKKMFLFKSCCLRFQDRFQLMPISVKSFLVLLFTQHKKIFFHRTSSFCYFFHFFFKEKIIIWSKWPYKKWSGDASKRL